MKIIDVMVLLMMLLGSIASVDALATDRNTGDHVSKNVKHTVDDEQLITLNLNDVALNEVMEMLSSIRRVNILLGKNVSGKVNVNLFNVSFDDAINSIVSVSGYAVERRNGTYFIALQEDLDKSSYAMETQTRSFQIEYSDVTAMEMAVKKILSPHGMVSVLKDRRLLVVKDVPSAIRRVASVITAIDKRPDQIMIEARILEVTLDNTETYGINWKNIIQSGSSVGSIGLGTIDSANPSGAFVNIVNRNVEVFLEALQSQGRVRTLSTPKLLTMENQEASVVIGDRIGYKTTTTINAVSTENIEFLESGVILKVRSTVDENNQILLNIHPEVSTGTISDGVPSQSTTEVTTQLIVSDGDSVFIGGLMKNTQSERDTGVPILREIPALKWLFASKENINIKTETLVMITPKIIHQKDTVTNENYTDKINEQVINFEKLSLDFKREMER